MEYVDILDMDGNKIGVKSREEASKDKDIYRIVYLWIITNKKILIQQRSFNKKSNPGLWDCAVAGHVLSGENSVNAILREAKEELNLDLREKELKLIYSNVGCDDKYQFHDVFIINKEIDVKKITIQKEEVECFKLVTAKELKDIIDSEFFAKDFHNLYVVNKIFKILKSKIRLHPSK